MKKARSLPALFVAGLVGWLLIPALAQAQASPNVSITLKEFSLTPAQVTVPAGQPVHFTVTNSGAAQHNFKVELPAQHIEQTLFATNLKPGESQTADYTFPVAGTWEMYCPVDSHENMGMKGSLEVIASGGAAGATGSQPSGGAGGQTALPRTGGAPRGDGLAGGAIAFLVLGIGLVVRRRSPRPARSGSGQE